MPQNRIVVNETFSSVKLHSYVVLIVISNISKIHSDSMSLSGITALFHAYFKPDIEFDHYTFSYRPKICSHLFSDIFFEFKYPIFNIVLGFAKY